MRRALASAQPATRMCLHARQVRILLEPCYAHCQGTKRGSSGSSQDKAAGEAAAKGKAPAPVEEDAPVPDDPGASASSDFQKLQVISCFIVSCLRMHPVGYYLSKVMSTLPA